MAECFVVVVDDDVISLKNARNILVEQNIKAGCLKSGKELLTFIEKNEPDLILLDVMMPEMDGFETYSRLREFEEFRGRQTTPVIFITGDEDEKTEKRGLEIGASDFVHKPFNKESLIWRIRNIVAKRKEIETLAEEATIDRLTGFLNKAAAAEKLGKLCKNETGVLAILDLDNFKLVNDIYGHEMGDGVLSSFAGILLSSTQADDTLCRIGGDEFIAFFCGLSDENVVVGITRRLNEQLKNKCTKLMGSDFAIDIGVSVGCTSVNEKETEYEVLFRRADKALLNVKKNGKHGCSFYDPLLDVLSEGKDLNRELSLITQIVEERGESGGALWINQDAFAWGYRFIMRFLKRSGGVATRMLLSVSPGDGADDAILPEAVEDFGRILQKNIRKSDLMMQYGKNMFFVLFPELSAEHIDVVIKRVMDDWETSGFQDRVRIDHVMEIVDNRAEEKSYG